MKSREYYEQLLSRQMDGSLTEVEQQELEQAMVKDPTLKEFGVLLKQHAEMLRTLPDPKASSAPSTARSGTHWIVAASLAALLVLSVIGNVIGWLGGDGSTTSAVEEQPSKQPEIIHVQFAPQSATRQ